MNKFIKLLKNKKILYAAIGLNLGLFALGFSLADLSIMALALMSMTLCYIGAESEEE